jgi:hypothetical protein
MIKLLTKTKKRPVEAAFSQRGKRGRENLSGKAMPNVVLAYAKTHGLKKSHILEDG